MMGLGAAAWPVVARAQQSKLPVVGYLSPERSTASFIGGMQAGLQELGHIVGQNLIIESRWAGGRFESLLGLAQELVQLRADVIVSVVTQASLAAKSATTTIPIVMVAVADPVAVGLVASLSRPGGNITGTSGMSNNMVGVQLRMLAAVVPDASRIAVLWNPANLAFQTLQLKQVEAAASVAGAQLQMLEVREASDIDSAFDAIDRDRTRALLILADPLFTIHNDFIIERLTKRRLPAAGGIRLFAERGGLMAYGPDFFDLNRRSAAYVDKILKGANPADLPIEQPTKFEFVVNLKTAKRLGLAIPEPVLVFADVVIE
jgi:putative tryptophan/tyrosine transport system substrate-binding protein